MSWLWLLIVLFLIFALVGVPNFGVMKHDYGYAPSGILFFVVVVLLILLLTGRL